MRLANIYIIFIHTRVDHLKNPINSNKILQRDSSALYVLCASRSRTLSSQIGERFFYVPIKYAYWEKMKS